MTRKCTVCGKEKPLSEMSKSYPARCKECVAEHTKMVRKIARRNDADLIAKNIDWEQRRYEIAKSAMQGFCSNSAYDDTCERHAELSVIMADALIKKLKGE